MKNAINQFRNSLIFRFITTYILLMGIFFLLIGLKSFKDIIDINGSYTQAIVTVTSFIINILGIEASYSGSLIKLPSIILDIEFGCNGLEAVMIFAVAVLSYPGSWKIKITGMFFGFLVIQVLNIVRIAALVYTGVYFKDIFEFFHIYIAQGIMIAVSLAVFIGYLHFVHYSDEKDKATE